MHFALIHISSTCTFPTYSRCVPLHISHVSTFELPALLNRGWCTPSPLDVLTSRLSNVDDDDDNDVAVNSNDDDDDDKNADVSDDETVDNSDTDDGNYLTGLTLWRQVGHADDDDWCDGDADDGNDDIDDDDDEGGGKRRGRMRMRRTKMTMTEPCSTLRDHDSDPVISPTSGLNRRSP